MQPLLVDIKRGSLEDGPGIRSVVFFKGCPLRCVFCHSPETQDHRVNRVFGSSAVLVAGLRRSVPARGVDMSFGAHSQEEVQSLRGLRGGYARGGINHIGTYYSPEELCEILIRDIAYYHHSNGGVTLSGGECTL